MTDDEASRYLGVCPQPWKDAATLILGTGLRPGEVFKLRWEFVPLNGHGGLIQVAEGKSKAARRLLPMAPAVYTTLKSRLADQGCPSEGWVFPTGAVCGHLEQGTAKTHHSRALAILQKAHEEEQKTREKVPEEKPEEHPEVEPFEPHCLRHTALTNLAAVCPDAFALAQIAGHSSIQITMRYVHPQADAIERTFAQFANRQEVVADGGHKEKALPDGRSSQSASAEESEVLVSREGIEPPTY